MPRREISPALSENEIDIVGSLFTDDVDDVDDGNSNLEKLGANRHGFGFDAGGILEAGNESDDGDGDEAFIALQQSASFRKTTNLKGKTVKKGGGFQAMGINANLLRAINRKGFSVPTPIQRKTIPLILVRF
jgi:ATP-dependent RNA helicase DDX54/DBP10